MPARLLLLLLAALPLCAAQKLLVISVDGLDQRYLEERAARGLKLPNVRRLLAQAQWSRGVVGTFPTVTWPSHTTIITGVAPHQHGILSNRRPAEEGGDYYWSASLLKVKTLLNSAKTAGKTTAAITWPVTVDAPVDYNLPEYFRKRRGGFMDLPSIASKANPPDLVDRITQMFPSFPQEWMDDRTRTLATVWMLKTVRPDLILLHLVDHDSEAHEAGPFTRQAHAVLEYTDELIGQMLAAAGPDYAVALVSDHGFERVDQEVHLRAVAEGADAGQFEPMGGIVVARDERAAQWLRTLQRDPRYGIGREIPAGEFNRVAPQLRQPVAVFEPAPGCWFGSGNDKPFGRAREIGAHGHWPTRYRAVFALKAAGVKPERTPELPMTEIVGVLAKVLGVAVP